MVNFFFYQRRVQEEEEEGDEEENLFFCGPKKFFRLDLSFELLLKKRPAVAAVAEEEDYGFWIYHLALFIN